MKMQPMKKLNLFKYVSGCSKILATTSYRTTPHRETNSEMGFEEDSGISGLGMIMKCKPLAQSCNLYEPQFPDARKQRNWASSKFTDP